MVHEYIYNLLVITKDDFTDQIKTVDFLQKLAEVGLKINAEKLFSGRTETKYFNL